MSWKSSSQVSNFDILNTKICRSLIKNYMSQNDIPQCVYLIFPKKSDLNQRKCSWKIKTEVKPILTSLLKIRPNHKDQTLIILKPNSLFIHIMVLNLNLPLNKYTPRLTLLITTTSFYYYPSLFAMDITFIIIG